MASKNNNAGFGMLDTPWLRQQVEGHLVFGLFSSHNKLFWSAIVLLGGMIVNILFHSVNREDYISLIFNIQTLLIVVSVTYLARFSGFYQAAIWWVATKLGFFFISFIFLLTGIVNSMQGIKGALLQIVLGIVWLPSIEFHPIICRNQKILSIFRFLVALLIIPQI